MHLNSFIHDLVDNASFRKWVLSDFETDDEIWSTFIDAHENNESDINDAIRLVRELYSSQQELPVFQTEETWNKIQESTGTTLEKPLHTGGATVRMLIKRIAVAAVFITVISFAWLLIRSGNLEVVSGDGDMITHQLPDGSQVTLNRKSQITYNPDNWNEVREVRLSGEAYFEVKKGSDFIVKTPDGEVEVLGTSFNVYSRDSKMNVTCYTGKVAVRNSADDVILLPGQEVFKNELGNLEMISAAISDSESPWINNLIRFNNTSLDRVVEELNIYYGNICTIDPVVADLEFTGIIPSDNRAKAIENLTWALGLKYKISKEGQYHIYR